MNVRIIKVMARFGTPSSIIGAFMIGISILSANNWSFTENTLSALGVMGSGSAILYNSGLLMAGATAMLLAAGLFEFTGKDIIGQVGSAIFLAYSVAVCILGISILDLGDWVQYVSPAIYMMIPVCSILLGYSFYNKDMKREAGMGVVSAVVGIGVWVLGGPVTAVNQLVALLPFSLWQILFGLHMYRLEFNEWD
jgi:hypothetical membrane protein